MCFIVKQKIMKTKFKGIDCNLKGAFLQKGDALPAFELTTAELGTVDEATYKGKKIVFNIFPSLDTGVCAASVRRFNVEAAKLPDTVVVCVSMDLPFAIGRFCVAEGIKSVIAVSAFRDAGFGEKFGVMLADGPLRGLLARAVVVVDKDGMVKYSQLVDEITTEPDYEKAIAALED